MPMAGSLYLEQISNSAYYMVFSTGDRMKKTAALIMILLMLVGVLPFIDVQEVSGNTSVPNINISTPVEWNLTGSPYYIEGHVTIKPGGTLTILPGVEVKFNGPYAIFVEGSLEAMGQQGQAST